MDNHIKAWLIIIFIQRWNYFWFYIWRLSYVKSSMLFSAKSILSPRQRREPSRVQRLDGWRFDVGVRYTFFRELSARERPVTSGRSPSRGFSRPELPARTHASSPKIKSSISRSCLLALRASARPHSMTTARPNTNRLRVVCDHFGRQFYPVSLSFFILQLSIEISHITPSLREIIR